MKLNIVPARTGVLWVRQGLRTFWRQPLALSGLFFLFITSVSFASLIPVLGNALALGLLPAATLGLMLATREAEQGRFPMPVVLISAFRGDRPRVRAMLWLGVIYALAFLGVLGLSALLDGGQFARLYLVGGSLSLEMMESESFQHAMWLSMALYLPLSLLFWHAPGLVYWHGVPPVKSLFFSAVACMRNFGAMTVYALAWCAVFAISGMTLMMVSMLLGMPGLMATLMLPLVLLLAAMFFSSIYFSFRDSYTADLASESR